MFTKSCLIHPEGVGDGVSVTSNDWCIMPKHKQIFPSSTYTFTYWYAFMTSKLPSHNDRGNVQNTKCCMHCLVASNFSFCLLMVSSYLLDRVICNLMLTLTNKSWPQKNMSETSKPQANSAFGVQQNFKYPCWSLNSPYKQWNISTV